MITIADASLDIIEVTAAQNPGDVCPSFTLTIKPHEGTAQSVSTHLTWTPPDPLSISVDGAAWACVPLDRPIRVSGKEVTYQVTYAPRLFHLLRRGKLQKPAIFVSAPRWEQHLYLEDLSSDDYHIFHADADAYASDGLTVADIFEAISGIVGFSLRALLPPLHVSQKTLLCDEQTPILDFLCSLLPSGLPYAWDMQNDAATVSLIPMSSEFTNFDEGVSVEVAIPPVEAFHAIAIQGLPYQPCSVMALGGAGFGSSSSTTSPPIFETLPVEESMVDTVPTRTERARIVIQDAHKTPFAVTQETEQVWTNGVLTRRVVTQNTFEQDNPARYETPRLLRSERATSGMVTQVSQGALLNSDALLLTGGLKVMTRAEYAAVAGTKPSILYSAIAAWRDDYELITDEKTYTPPESASRSWPEGTETRHAQTTRCWCALLDGRPVKASDAPATVLQNMAAVLAQKTDKAGCSFGMGMRTIESLARRVALTAPGVYRYEETAFALDAASGAVVPRSATLPINGELPSAPTRYRAANLEARLNTGSSFAAAPAVVLRAGGQIPTANPTDFAAWAHLMFLELTSPRKTATISGLSAIMPVGYAYAGGTVTGWSASQRGNVYQVTLTIS